MSHPPLTRILLVEDDPDIQMIAEMALSGVGGYELQTCDNGRAALSEVPIYQPQLILMDVMMPEMDGPTTLQELRRNPDTRHIPVVFMTAKTQEHDKAHYLELGALDVIAKPFDPMALPKTIAAIWEAETPPALPDTGEAEKARDASDRSARG